MDKKHPGGRDCTTRQHIGLHAAKSGTDTMHPSPHRIKTQTIHTYQYEASVQQSTKLPLPLVISQHNNNYSNENEN